MRTGPPAEDIQRIFGSIAQTYDKVNGVITFGMARWWRQKLVQWSEAHDGHRILDCATGTGDLALQFKQKVGPQGHVVGVDFCEEILAYAVKKAKQRKLTVDFQWGDVTQLSNYKNDSFDISSIAYGIRNVSDIKKALVEMARVVKPGGHVMILETGEQYFPILKPFIHFYFKHIVPPLGGWISGHHKAYHYLSQSSSEFPCRQKFIDIMMSTSCFKSVQHKSLMGGASFIYKAEVSSNIYSS